MLEVSKAGHRIFRNQVGQYKLADGRYIRSGLCVGSSDLIGFSRDGKFIALEIKQPGQHASAEQQKFIDAVNNAGGIAGVAHSVDEAMALLSR